MGGGRSSRSWAGAIACVAIALASSDARADSGRLNLHLDVGFGGAVAGASARHGDPGDPSLGGMGIFLLDWQLRAPFAIEAMVGGGGFARAFPTSGKTGAGYSVLAIGARIRFLDDDHGYADDRGGNTRGNFFVATHFGMHRFDERQFGMDVTGGYEWSVHRPLSIGAFVRTLIAFGGYTPSTDVVLLGGVSLSVELVGPPHRHDSDGDGLPDDRERQLGTDPNRTDTDHDGILDGTEDATGTDPRDDDSDHDGLRDGREDANHDGIVDAHETNPRRSDSDGGGVPDYDEVFTYHTDPTARQDDDDDQDGVSNPIDTCPGTPAGAAVDATGCPDSSASFVVPGVTFAEGRTRLAPESEAGLTQALHLIERGAGARFEVAVFAPPGQDPTAAAELAQRRADAVVAWFAQHGVDRDRLVPHGFAGEGTAGAARVELRRVDGGR